MKDSVVLNSDNSLTGAVPAGNENLSFFLEPPVKLK